MDLIIHNAHCVLPEGILPLDVGVHEGKIAALGKLDPKTAKESLDAKGNYLIPGVIDSQVHFREPGLTHKEDLKSGSRAALLGGVSTFLEMPNTSPPTVDAASIEEKVKLAQSKCLTHFGFFMGATDYNLRELQKVSQSPFCCGIKIFLGSSTGDLLLHDEKILLDIFQQTDSVIAIHSENETLLQKNIHLHSKATRPHAHTQWRSVEVALTSTKRIVALAKKAQRKIHILHISTQEEMEFLSENKDHCTVEVTPQHLTLTAPDCYDRLGTYAQMNPPIREKRHRQALWKGVHNGTVDVIGSDHAPHTRSEKDQGYPKSPSGMPGVQTMLPLMLQHLSEGRLSLEKIVELLCSAPAKLYSLSQKGRISQGLDADLVLLDLEQEVTLTHDMMASRCGWTPFHGKKVKGFPTHTIVAGKISMENQKILS